MSRMTKVCLPLVPVAGAIGLLAGPLAGQSAATMPLSVFGEVRSRSEWNSATHVTTGDAFTYLRARLGLRAEPVPGARIVLQGQDSRVVGSEGSTTPAAVAADVFELHQGYLELFSRSGTITATVRAGRQEIALGNERLVGAANWTNVARSFDGARLLFAPRSSGAARTRWTASVAAATVEERGSRFGTSTVLRGRPDRTMAVAYVTRALANDAMFDGTVLYERGGQYRAYDDATRTTLDSRLVARLGSIPFRAEVEGALQAGRQHVAANARAQDVRAWLAGARLTTLPAGPRRILAGIGADLLSGDATPLDARYTAFSTMYGTNHPFYGWMDIIGDPATTTKDRGLVDLFTTASFALIRSTSVRADVHRFTTRAGSDDRHLGWESDFVLPIRLNSASVIDVGWSFFHAGSAAAAADISDAGETRSWAYVQLGVTF